MRLAIASHLGCIFTETGAPNYRVGPDCSRLVGWLVGLGLTALWNSISVYIGPTPKERETEERKDRRE